MAPIAGIGGTYGAQDRRGFGAVEPFGDRGNVGDPRDDVLREGAVDGEAAELGIQTACGRREARASEKGFGDKVGKNTLCSRPLRQGSQSRHEYASHLIPTRSPTLTGES